MVLYCDSLLFLLTYCTNRTKMLRAFYNMFIPKTVVDKIYYFFMSNMLGWCSSYQYMIVTMWIVLGLIIYAIVFILLKIIFSGYKNQSDVVQKMCSTIEENDTVGFVRLLQEHSQCINKFNDYGYTPFLIACANGNTQLVKLMLKKGADVKLNSLKNESPFYLAAFYYIKHPQYKNATCIRELYYAGANIDEPNNKGLTPLQMAATFGHTPLAKWLLLKSASTKIVPDPYILASSQGHQDTAYVIWNLCKHIAIDCK